MSNRKYRKFIFIPLLLGALFSNAQTKDSVKVPVKDSLTAKKQEVAEVKYPQFQFKGLFRFWWVNRQRRQGAAVT